MKSKFSKLAFIALLLLINTSYAQVPFDSYEGGVNDCYDDLEKNAQALIDQGVCDLTDAQIEKINNGAGVSLLNLSGSQKADVKHHCNQMGKLRESLVKKYKL